MSNFRDRVAIVTGGGSGLGRSHALALAKEGAAVVVNDIGGAPNGEGSDTSSAQFVVNEIVDAGGIAVSSHHTVATPEGGEAIVQTALEAFGRIDIVVNNAGILRDRSFAKLEPSDLRSVIAVHLEGAFYVTQPAFRVMKEQRYGRIVATSSASGLFGNFGQANYGAAKMGLVGLVNVLAIEGANHNVKANAVAPLAATRMTEDLLGESALLFKPELVTPAVLYLASEECVATGEVWAVAAGTISRVVTAVGRGYIKRGDEPLNVEDIAANIADIRSLDELVTPNSLQEEIQRIVARLTS